MKKNKQMGHEMAQKREKVSKLTLDDQSMKYHCQSGSDEFWIVLDPQQKVLEVFHSSLSKRDLQLINDHYLSQNLDDLLDLSLGSLYRLYQKMVIETEIEDEKELEEFETFIDEIELQECSIFSLPLEELRELCLFIKYPETNGEVLGESFQGHLICRCFGVSKQQIDQLLEENMELTLKEVNAHLQVGTGCGSCMEDVKGLITLMHKRQNPSPIEWMIDFNKMLNDEGVLNWGNFLGVSEVAITVKLEKITQEKFREYVSKTGVKNLNFLFE